MPLGGLQKHSKIFTSRNALMSHLLLGAHKLSKEEARKIIDQVQYRNVLHDREQRFLSLLNRTLLLVDIILLYGEPLNCRRNKLCSLDVGDGRHSVGLVSTHQPCATLLVVSDILKTYLVASTPSLVGFLTYRRVERIRSQHLTIL